VKESQNQKTPKGAEEISENISFYFFKININLSESKQTIPLLHNLCTPPLVFLVLDFQM
jgi:hypothetical protein